MTFTQIICRILLNGKATREGKMTQIRWGRLLLVHRPGVDLLIYKFSTYQKIYVVHDQQIKARLVDVHDLQKELSNNLKLDLC